MERLLQPYNTTVKVVEKRTLDQQNESLSLGRNASKLLCIAQPIKHGVGAQLDGIELTLWI